MHNITFISTIHKELGKCNSEELFKIIDYIKPEVVFLEADDKTYSDYENHTFLTYGVYHNKLEISAIQKYSSNSCFQYVPVCGINLTDALHTKHQIVCQYRELQILIDNFNSLAEQYGFYFLNSLECIHFHDEMRFVESRLLNNNDFENIVKADIEAYENSMIRNIYSYCENNQFSSAVFMCGAAHRKSIIKKTQNFDTAEKLNVIWTIFGN